MILDEVMTSRMSGHGLAHLHRIKPDLKTFGKWLGGGLAFGAFGGRADIMATFDPRLGGSLSHSGTFNNNSLVTHAGYVGMTQVYPPSTAVTFTAIGNDLRSRLNRSAQGTRLQVTGCGTVMAIHIPCEAPTDQRPLGPGVEEDQTLMDLFWFEMLHEGFWIARRGLIALILGTPATELNRFVSAVDGFITRYHEFLVVQ